MECDQPVTHASCHVSRTIFGTVSQKKAFFLYADCVTAAENETKTITVTEKMVNTPSLGQPAGKDINPCSEEAGNQAVTTQRNPNFKHLTCRAQ